MPPARIEAAQRRKTTPAGHAGLDPVAAVALAAVHARSVTIGAGACALFTRILLCPIFILP